MAKIDSNYASKFRTWAEEGLSYQGMADKFLAEDGIKVDEATVRRFFRRHKLEKPLVQEVVPEEVRPDSSLTGRASRRLQDEQTVEDKLRDDLDHYKARVKEAETVIKRYKEQESVESRLARHIEHAIENNPYNQPLAKAPGSSGGKVTAKPHEFLLCVSDAHYGEVVRPEEALGLKYDTDIARRRIEHVRNTAFRFHELRSESYPVNKITIAVLGDMLSGIIHEELEVTNEIVMVDQATEMAHMLYNLYADCSERFPAVEMVVIPGNHPRLHKKPRHKQKFNNYEFMMGKMVEGMVKANAGDNAALTVKVPRDLAYVHTIFDYRIAMMHGDGVMSNSFAGIPFYGLRQRREAIQALMSTVGEERIDMLLMGHFHQYMDWKGECDVVINPSIKGGDEFGISTRLQAPEAMQLLMEWHPEHGRTATNYINLEHIT